MNKNKKKSQTSDIKQQLKTNQAHIENGVFVFYEPLTIAQFAKAINQPIIKFIRYFFDRAKTLNQNDILSIDMITELCLEFDLEFRHEQILTHANLIEDFGVVDKQKDLKPRSPIVTIMGHVDHGKTTLLDTIRKSKVTSQEYGGITQHIGAYQIATKDNKLITFLDTPGHEAFTQMRARGSKVTDIVVLVVSAVDSVQPQTIEAIDHAKAANVEIIVFINKTDLPTANSEKVMEQLAAYELIPQKWGGQTIFVEGSALKMKGIDELLETILLLAELKDFKSNPNRFAQGTVIEANLDKNLGPSCTLLVQAGTLKLKDIIVVGNAFGKIKRMENDLGKEIKYALPSTPVKVFGLNSLPKAGDLFMVFRDEKLARTVSLKRKSQNQIQERRQKQVLTLDNLSDQINTGQLQQINIILKADNQGSLEALKYELNKININGITVSLVRASASEISESDITLASASSALIYGFNIRASTSIIKLADEHGVTIHLHNVIYKIISELEHLAQGLVEPEYEDISCGKAEVRKLFYFSKVGTIAGCYVVEGSIKRNSKIKVIRNGEIIHDGQILSLKHNKDDLKEVKTGHECGITIKNFNDIKELDIIESYVVEEVKNE